MRQTGALPVGNQEVRQPMFTNDFDHDPVVFSGAGNGRSASPGRAMARASGGRGAGAFARFEARRLGLGRGGAERISNLMATGRYTPSRESFAAARRAGITTARGGGRSSASRTAASRRSRGGGAFDGNPVATQRRGGVLPPNRRPRPRRR